MNHIWTLIARPHVWNAVGRQIGPQAVTPYGVAAKLYSGTPLVNGSPLLWFRLAY